MPDLHEDPSVAAITKRGSTLGVPTLDASPCRPPLETRAPERLASLRCGLCHDCTVRTENQHRERLGPE